MSVAVCVLSPDQVFSITENIFSQIPKEGQVCLLLTCHNFRYFPSQAHCLESANIAAGDTIDSERQRLVRRMPNIKVFSGSSHKDLTNKELLLKYYNLCDGLLYDTPS